MAAPALTGEDGDAFGKQAEQLADLVGGMVVEVRVDGLVVECPGAELVQYAA
ncbi:hypothetical protein [Actinomadura fibrosa]|uniref:Uncharacterized protein n=1 Tax=Actinomadura fibrosa TaxID=111802 RepID=A0ABW2XE69_9ACTN|nr:hypothetical protein [Actinomadura fibrosa]